MAKKEVKKEKVIKEDVKDVKEEKVIKEEVKKEPSLSEKEKIHRTAPVNELKFRVGDELEVKGLPFKVKEVRGLEISLVRTDIR